MLVYFDPWLAGVVLPSLILVGLMAIPYIDVNEKGNGYYTYQQRKFAIWTFFFGFILLWVGLIVIGTFVRGPGWMWFWPGEYWDSHRVVFETNVNLHELLGFADNTTGAYVAGGLALGGYFAVGGLIVQKIFQAKAPAMFTKMGPARFFTFNLLFLVMMTLPIKMVLRTAFSIKYIWTTPYFNF
jgi:uncharacterized membrane protein